MSVAISLPSIDDATAARLRIEAERRGITIEELVLELVQQGIENLATPPYHDLDALAGTWSKEQEDEFLKAIAEFEQVDGILAGSRLADFA